MTAIPERIMQEAKDAVRANFDIGNPWSETIARAILAAEERATQRERERCAETMDEVKAVFDMMDGDGVRARTFEDLPEDAVVEAVCERFGYGAVMDAAARLWFRKDQIGAFVSGPCAVTVRDIKTQLAAIMQKENGE